ncbi:MAG: hypothetical protein CMN05_15460 [Roseibacillus sp.]|jgi:hypothetical protein|nr:hypothetical protein [Roseibacillus sp.]MBP34706.1 hypothetical protein [Roseibacillus sp.]
MLAEIIARRNGLESGAAFGTALNQVAGFTQPFEKEFWRCFDGPIFVAAHNLNEFGRDYLKVYLRRDFEAVWRSTQKAQAEMERCWWGGTREECYEKWSTHVADGCRSAKAVIDYEITRSDPAATVRAICAAVDYEVSEKEVDAAVRAGSRENMLAEQSLHCPHREWDIVNSPTPSLS